MPITNPSTKELLGVLDALAENRNITPVGAVAWHAAMEMRRLLAGDFTPEEVHNFCHKIPETVSAQEFASGCMAYQTQIYGNSPVMELLRATDSLLEAWGFDSTGMTGPASSLRCAIQEQILD